MLNELKTSSKEATRLLASALARQVGEEAAFEFMSMLQETRAHCVEAARERLLERLHVEAWKAATAWARSRARAFDSGETNLILGIALSIASLLEWLANDGGHPFTFRHVHLARDPDGFLMLLDETLGCTGFGSGVGTDLQ